MAEKHPTDALWVLAGLDEPIVDLVESMTAGTLRPLTLCGRTPPGRLDTGTFTGRVTPGRAIGGSGWDEIELDVAYLLVPAPAARTQVLALVRKLRPHGVTAVVVALDGADYAQVLGATAAMPEELEDRQMIAVYPGDPIWALWLRQTAAASRGKTTEEIAGWLEQLGERCRFTIVGAGLHWLDLELETVPEDLDGFAEEICELCPEVLQQGYLGPPLAGFGGFDLSDPEASMDALEAFHEVIDSQVPADLADAIEYDRCLLLWWD